MKLSGLKVLPEYNKDRIVIPECEECLDIDITEAIEKYMGCSAGLS